MGKLSLVKWLRLIIIQDVSYEVKILDEKCKGEKKSVIGLNKRIHYYSTLQPSRLQGNMKCYSSYFNFFWKVTSSIHNFVGKILDPFLGKAGFSLPELPHILWRNLASVSYSSTRILLFGFGHTTQYLSIS